MIKTKKQRLTEWLQNYANEHKCNVCVNSDYSPCVIAIWENPIHRYDYEDGYWYWDTTHKKAKWEWLDDKIPENLQLKIFDLMGEKGTIFTPKKKNEIV